MAKRKENFYLDPCPYGKDYEYLAEGDYSWVLAAIGDRVQVSSFGWYHDEVGYTATYLDGQDHHVYLDAKQGPNGTVRYVAYRSIAPKPEYGSKIVF